MADDQQVAARLARYLTACADEYIARHNEPDGAWSHDGEHYDVDQDVDEGPVELVRRSDGARFQVDVSVIAWPKVEQAAAVRSG